MLQVIQGKGADTEVRHCFQSASVTSWVARQAAGHYNALRKIASKTEVFDKGSWDLLGASLHLLGVPSFFVFEPAQGEVETDPNAVKALFNQLWGRAMGNLSYDKNEWSALQQCLIDLEVFS